MLENNLIFFATFLQTPHSTHAFNRYTELYIFF